MNERKIRERSQPAALTNVDAEKIIIGRILQSETTFWEINGTIQSFHFSIEIHQRIFESIYHLLMDGKKATLSLLQSRIGPEYGDGSSTMTLMTALIRNTSEVEDIIREVQTVIECWQRRRVIEICDQFSKEAKQSDTDTSYMLGDLENVVKDITVNSQSEPVKTMADIVSRVVSSSMKTKATGVSPGFDSGLASLDQILGRIFPGDLGFIGARPGDGKGQPLDALVLTPFGYKKMGDIKVGAIVSSPDGSASEVIGVYPLGERQLYRVSFHDGTSTEVTEDHIWYAWCKGRGRQINGKQVGGEDGAKLFTTAGLIDILKNKRAPKIYIPISKPIQFTMVRSERDCLIPPYTMGALLGDGSFRHNRVSFTSADMDIVEKMEGEIGCKLLVQANSSCGKATAYLVPVSSGVRDAVLEMGLLEAKSVDKFIPTQYLMATVEKRWELLRGLMDTDGWVNVNGDPRIHTKSPQLAKDIAWLARSLGAVVSTRKKQTYYTKDGERIDCGIGYELRIKLWDGSEAFSLQRKKDKCNKPQSLARKILSIEPTRMAEAQCIKVSDPNSLYLTNDFIVTHNTVVGLQLLDRIQQHYGPACFFSLEMRDQDLGRRILAGKSNVSVSEIEEGSYDAFELEEIRAAQEVLSRSRMLVDDRPGLRIDQIRDRCVVLKRSKGLKAIVIDHIRLVRALGKFSNRFDRAEYVTGMLKTLAKELEIAVIALSQVTRASQRRDDPRPQLNDFDGGSSIEQDADWALGLFRRDRWLRGQKPYDMDSKEGKEWAEDMQKCKGKIEVINLKRRRGEDGGHAEFIFDGKASLLREVER